MRLAVLTSVETRHRYFSRCLASRLPVAVILHESTGYSPAGLQSEELTETERRIVDEHFEERGRQERRFFGGVVAEEFPSFAGNVVELAPGTLNSVATLKHLENAQVDTVAVFGTNLIREPLISRYAGRIVNLHLGLSPYYRGTATNFYPLLNEEPEYVGATIHLIDPGIDSGPILRHARPRIEPGDRPHTIGCKAIQAGVDAMVQVLEHMDRDELLPVPQWNPPNAKLYLRRDYHPRQVVDLYRKWDGGLLDRYLARSQRVRDRVRLVE